MKPRILSMSLILLAVLALSTGCDTIGKGVGNIFGDGSESATDTTRQYEGNLGAQSTIPASQQDHEQAIAFGLAMHVESLRYSIDRGDREKMKAKLKGLLVSCDEAIERLEGENGLRAKQIRSAVAIIKQAGPVYDSSGLKTAMAYLQAVRDG